MRPPTEVIDCSRGSDMMFEYDDLEAVEVANIAHIDIEVDDAEMAATIATETETLFTDVAEMDSSEAKISDEDFRQSAEDEQKRLIALGIATEEIKKIEGAEGRESSQEAQQIRIDRLIQDGAITHDGRVVIGGKSSSPMDLDVLAVGQEVQ